MTHHSICTTNFSSKCSYLCSTCQMHLSMKNFPNDQIEVSEKIESKSQLKRIAVERELK